MWVREGWADGRSTGTMVVVGDEKALWHTRVERTKTGGVGDIAQRRSTRRCGGARSVFLSPGAWPNVTLRYILIA